MIAEKGPRVMCLTNTVAANFTPTACWRRQPWTSCGRRARRPSPRTVSMSGSTISRQPVLLGLFEVLRLSHRRRLIWRRRRETGNDIRLAYSFGTSYKEGGKQ